MTVSAQYSNLPAKVKQALVDVESSCEVQLRGKEVLLFAVTKAVKSRLSIESLIRALHSHFNISAMEPCDVDLNTLKALSILRTLLSRDDKGGYALRNVLRKSKGPLKLFIDHNRHVVGEKEIWKGVLCGKVKALLQTGEAHATELYDSFVSMREELGIKDDSYSLIKICDHDLKAVYASKEGSVFAKVVGTNSSLPQTERDWIKLFNNSFPKATSGSTPKAVVGRAKVVAKVSRKTFIALQCDSNKKSTEDDESDGENLTLSELQERIKAKELQERINATKKKYLSLFGKRSGK